MQLKNLNNFTLQREKIVSLPYHFINFMQQKIYEKFLYWFSDYFFLLTFYLKYWVRKPSSYILMLNWANLLWQKFSVWCKFFYSHYIHQIFYSFFCGIAPLNLNINKIANYSKRMQINAEKRNENIFIYKGDMGEKPIWEQLSAFWNSLNKIILLERATAAVA